MNLFIDTDSHQAIQGIGARSPVSPITFKIQDTPSLNVYFVSSGFALDYGESAAVKFGLNLPTPAAVSLLVLDFTFSRQVDTSGNVYYRGFPIFDTVQLAAALGSLYSINCVGEIRYQLTDGEIVHTLDIPFQIFRTILSEISVDATAADFTVPAIGANVVVQIGNTNWLVVDQNLSIATAGVYKVASITDATHFQAQNTGAVGNAVPTTVISFPQTIGTTPPSVPNTYPDVSTIELKVNRDVASGYAALDASGYLKNTDYNPSTVELIATRDVASGHPSLDASALLHGAEIPVDGTTTKIVSGKLVAVGPALGVVSVVLSDFTVPAVGSNVVINADNTNLTVGLTYIISGGAGAYIFISVTDSTHGEFQNAGGPTNAAPATVIPFPVNIQWSGPTGVTGADGATGATGTAGATGAAGAAGAPGAAGATGPMGQGLTPKSSVSTSSSLPSSGNSVGDLRVTTDTDHGWAWDGSAWIDVGPAGATGATGAAGPTGPTGPTGAAGTFVDAETSTGDTLLGATSGTLKRIIPGTGITLDAATTPGGIIVNASGGGGGGGNPFAIIKLGSGWTYADNTAIPWSAVVSDATSMWSSGSPTKLTIAITGLYLVGFNFSVDPALFGSAGVLSFGVYKNGEGNPVLWQVMNLTGVNTAYFVSASGLTELTAGDFIEVYGAMIGGAAPTTVVAAASQFSALQMA